MNLSGSNSGKEFEELVQGFANVIASTVMGYIDNAPVTTLFEKNYFIAINTSGTISILADSFLKAEKSLHAYIAINSIPGIQHVKDLIGDGSNAAAVDLAVEVMSQTVASELIRNILNKNGDRH